MRVLLVLLVLPVLLLVFVVILVCSQDFFAILVDLQSEYVS